MRVVASVSALCLGLAGCMSQQDTASVEAAAARFHEMQSRGEDAAIFREAAPELRNVSAEENLSRLNSAVRSAAGCSAPARNPAVLNNNMSTSGHFITVAYDRQCEHGPLTETFVFKIDGEQATLAGYNVGGMALFPPGQAEPPPASNAASTP